MPRAQMQWTVLISGTEGELRASDGSGVGKQLGREEPGLPQPRGSPAHAPAGAEGQNRQSFHSCTETLK